MTQPLPNPTALLQQAQMQTQINRYLYLKQVQLKRLQQTITGK